LKGLITAVTNFISRLPVGDASTPLSAPTVDTDHRLYHLQWQVSGTCM